MKTLLSVLITLVLCGTVYGYHYETVYSYDNGIVFNVMPRTSIVVRDYYVYRPFICIEPAPQVYLYSPYHGHRIQYRHYDHRWNFNRHYRSR